MESFPNNSLILTTPGRPVRIFDISAALMTVGRGAANDIVLHDARVSRAHARLERRDGAFVLTDLGSANGVAVNGQPIQSAPVQPGRRWMAA